MLEQFIPGRLDETLPYYLAQYERFHDRCQRPFPGVEQVFSILRAKGMRAAIVTGKGPLSAEISMRVLGLGQWIDVIESGTASGANKPQSIQRVLGRWGVSPDQAAYVGDTPYDLTAAIEAGLQPIGAAWAPASLLRGDPIAAQHATFYAIDHFIDWLNDI